MREPSTLAPLTTRRAGPHPHLAHRQAVRIDQAIRVSDLVIGGASFRQAAAACGLSVTTAWRRYWLVWDWTTPTLTGRSRGPIPPQRHTRRSPGGDRPCLPTIDHPLMFRRPGVRCGARARSRGGEPCRNWAMRGGKRCRMHGGATKRAREAAARTLAFQTLMACQDAQVHRDHCLHGHRAVFNWDARFGAR